MGIYKLLDGFERESETFIPGNGGEGEFLLAHVVFLLFSRSEQVDKERSLGQLFEAIVFSV